MRFTTQYYVSSVEDLNLYMARLIRKVAFKFIFRIAFMESAYPINLISAWNFDTPLGDSPLSFGTIALLSSLPMVVKPGYTNS